MLENGWASNGYYPDVSNSNSFSATMLPQRCNYGSFDKGIHLVYIACESIFNHEHSLQMQTIAGQAKEIEGSAYCPHVNAVHSGFLAVDCGQ